MANANINVAEVLESNKSTYKEKFIRDSGINSDSAYERLRILKDTKKALKSKINATDTATVPRHVLEEYNNLAVQFEVLITKELLLIGLGK